MDLFSLLGGFIKSMAVLQLLQSYQGPFRLAGPLCLGSCAVGPSFLTFHDGQNRAIGGVLWW